MRVGVLTGGGDCPGLNAVIRAVVRKGVSTYGHEFVGFRDGWRGPLDGDAGPLGVGSARHPAPRRHDPRHLADQPVQGRRRRGAGQARAAAPGVEALIAIGGEDTLGVAKRLYETACKVVGVPKTIDNDLAGTDYTFGFDTAVNIAMEAIDRLHTTAESHHRALIVEVMGRHAGWIALHAGMAGGANVILMPEQPFDLTRSASGWSAGSRPTTRRSSSSPRARRPRRAGVAAHRREGRVRARPARRHRRAGWPRRWRRGPARRPARSVLGHVQRGGTPTAFDRVAGHPLRPGRDRRGAGRDVGADGRAARHRHRPGPAGRGDRGAEDGADPSGTRRPRCSSAEPGRAGPPGAEPAPAAQHPRPQQHEQQDPVTSSSARDRQRQAGVEHRERRDPGDGDVLADAHGDVARGLGRGVDDQPQAALDQVRHQRGGAAGRGEDRLLQRGCVLRDEQADHRADGRADRRGDRVPERVEVGILSATSSTRYSAAATTSTSVRVRPSGMPATSLNRPMRPRTSTTR